ncbi:MAG TPA: hypothetical protein DDW53_07720, partial [Lachnoclostridium sp.]|nr:hypothetical protein [Lachnoclostridium sp.]
AGRIYALKNSVVIIKPPGTLSGNRWISLARLAPYPPDTLREAASLSRIFSIYITGIPPYTDCFSACS